MNATGYDNKMDKREFRRLYKRLLINNQSTSLPSALPPMFSEGDLDKLSDYVFETYDFDGTGMIFIISLSNYFIDCLYTI
jgi:hypothetical protein